MRLLILYSFLSLFLCSCSLPLASLRDGVELGGEKAKLLNIRIERWQELRFSGLLAVRQEQDGLYYMLLDATGVKLLEARVSNAGEHVLIHANGALKETGLDEFLSEALARIYLFWPEQLPCSGSWFHSFCYRDTAASVAPSEWNKTVRLGPLKLWQVTGPKRGHGATAPVSYNQPWLGVDIVLQGVDHKGD